MYETIKILMVNVVRWKVLEWKLITGPELPGRMILLNVLSNSKTHHCCLGQATFQSNGFESNGRENSWTGI